MASFSFRSPCSLVPAIALRTAMPKSEISTPGQQGLLGLATEKFGYITDSRENLSDGDGERGGDLALNQNHDLAEPSVITECEQQTLAIGLCCQSWTILQYSFGGSRTAALPWGNE